MSGVEIGVLQVRGIIHMVTATENDKLLQAVGDKESQDSVNDTVDRVIITHGSVSDAIDHVVAMLHEVECLVFYLD